MLKSLIALRRSFAEKMTKIEMGGIQETKFGESGNVCEVVGHWAPQSDPKAIKGRGGGNMCKHRPHANFPTSSWGINFRVLKNNT